MAESLVLSGLKKEYARLAGELKAIEARAVEIKEALPHLRATIKMFSEECDVDEIRPVVPRKANKWFEPRQCSRVTLDVLRDAKAPMTTREIALEVMRRCGIEADSPRTIKGVTFGVYDALRMREGHSVQPVDTNPRTWRITPLSDL
jgi:hypothetical protein